MTAWMVDAACAGMDPEMWFPERTPGRVSFVPGGAERAVQVCAGCPVQVQCLDHAMHFGATCGVWGGRVATTDGTLRSVVTRPDHEAPIGRPTARAGCGTATGYAAHYRYREHPCVPCKQANKSYRLALKAAAS